MCTRYSLDKYPPASGRYGNAPVINLPFNWGDKPQKSVTEDGEPYPIIPIYTGSHLTPNFTGTVTETIEVVVNKLGDRMLAHLSANNKNTNLLFSSLRYSSTQ